MLHEFSRAGLLIGEEGLEKLFNSKIAVFGIGGVGSFVVEGLVRSGVGSLTLIDHDCISLTNINRQIHATSTTLGKPKVEVMRERILDINPKVQVNVYQEFYTPNNAEDFFHFDYDYIIDAIDNITGKIDLVIRAKEMKISIISSMGTGNKLDPTRFEISDIYETSVCPLAKVMRKELRRRNVNSLKVLYSKEEPIKIIKDEATESSDVGIYKNEVDDISANRRQVPGSISFVPSVAGLIIAGEVIKDIIGYKKEILFS